MKYSDLDDDQRRKDFVDHIEKRWKQLHELDVKHGEAALNFLMLVSGGSAAATLTFIGNAMKEGPAPGGAILMLGFFALSILFVGLLKARLVYHVRGIFINWRTQVKKFFSDEIEWHQMLESDEKAVADKATLALHLGWAALACWCAGVVVGFIKLQEDPVHDRKKAAVATETTLTTPASTSTEAGGKGFGNRCICAGQEIEQHRDGTGSAATPTAAEKEITARQGATTASSSPPVPAPAPSSAPPHPPSN